VCSARLDHFPPLLVSDSSEIMFTPAPLQIVLNIYDIHQSNSVLYSVGAGFYHTGVEVNGYEYSFSPSGVLRTRPRLPEFGTLREQMTMGTYNEGMSGINAVISTLRNSRFQQGAYDTMHLNCNHFSDAFCLATVHQSIPSWVNRMAGMGALATSKPSSADKSGDKMAAPGVVKSPDMLKSGNTKQPEQAKTNESAAGEEVTISQSIFSWFGWGSTESSATPNTNSAQDTASGDRPTNTAATSSSKKKELTDKQKELLAKIKS